MTPKSSSLEEGDEFPAICGRCCGESKYVRMMRDVNGEECRICTRPFTVFRWQLSGNEKPQKTVVCMTCARFKNCCQSCMLDIHYGIPLDLRDTALKMAGIKNSQTITQSSNSRNREIKALKADAEENNFERSNQLEGRSQEAREVLAKLAEKFNGQNNPDTSNTKRRITDAKKISNVKSSDISKILAKLPFNGLINLEDSDISLTSFFIFGFSNDMPQYIISEYCNRFGKIKFLSIQHRARCGYVTFTSRKGAESFASSIASNGLNENKNTPGLIVLDRYSFRVCWARPSNLGSTNDEQRKLSLVVAKVIKQLTERDKEYEDGASKKHKTGSTSKKKQECNPQKDFKKYNVARSDFEI